MTAALLNHLWQSTVTVGAIALLALCLRGNRAQVRYALWFAASMKFCVPFALLISVGSALANSTAVTPVSTSLATTPVSVSSAIEEIAQFAQPFDAIVAPATTRTSALNWQAWAIGIWIAGIAAVIAVRLRDWLRIRAIVRASTAAAIDGIAAPAGVSVRTTSEPIGPCVIGWWRSVLLLPAGLEQLPRPQLEAVIAHELCHVRRRDTLAAGAHMVVEAVFWFHPLVWWIGSRLVHERERACDEAVLALGIDPVDYSTAILSVCRRYVEAPLAYVAGVTGADLRRRIEAILIGRVGVRLSRAQQLALAVVAGLTVLLPVTAGTLAAPLAVSAEAMQASSGTQAFEIASIKPCSRESTPPRATLGGGSGGGAQSAGATSDNFSPGRAYWPCVDVRSLVHMAYVSSRGANRDPRDPINNWPPGIGGELADGTKTLVRGGPAWIYTDKYTIEAKTTEGADRLTMMGPMLQSLLESRFKLKVRKELEQAPMFEMVVSKGGLKLKPVREGDCDADRSKGPVVLSEAIRLGVKPTCNTINAGLHGGNWRYEHGGQTLGTVATMLSSELGVTVLDRTGIADIFNMTWEFGPDDSTPRALRLVERYGPQPPVPATAPTLFKALEEQIGVSLRPIKEQRAYFLIDHIERPTPNLPITERRPG